MAGARGWGTISLIPKTPDLSRQEWWPTTISVQEMLCPIKLSEIDKKSRISVTVIFLSTRLQVKR
jgi:hypothetical protein